MNCLKNKQGETGGGLPSWGVYNESKKRQALIHIWQKQEELGWRGTESHGHVMAL